MRSWRHPLPFGALAVCVCVLMASWPATTSADEELTLLERPAPFTDVADAADENNRFDFNVRVGFRRMQASGAITRETSSTTGRGETVTIARSRHVRNELLLGLDVGLYHDLMLSVDMPLVLTDERRLDPRSGAATDLERTSHGPLIQSLADGETFFSPLRSGLDQMSLALSWAPLNQFRHPHAPTFVLRATAHLSLGDLMGPCEDGDGDCGVSEGTHGFQIETRLSRRYRYVEPYGGLSLHARFVGRADQAYFPGGELEGYVRRRPPTEIGFRVGVAVVPWEHRGHHQRFVFDLFAQGQWVSAGRDYTALYDAFGSQRSGEVGSNDLLTTQNCEGVAPGGIDCAAAGLRQIPFTGLTEVQPHGRFGAGVNIHLQAARFVRFQLGARVTYTSPHAITGARPCNASVTPSPSDRRVGGCPSGILNPAHRPIIDTPGNRFRRDGFFELSLHAGAAAQF